MEKQMRDFHACDAYRAWRTWSRVKKWTCPLLATCLLGLPAHVIATEKTPSIASTAQQQTRQIKGVVKDANGEPVIGANVVEKGTTNGTVTDLNGSFVLNVSPRARIQFSYVGMHDLEQAATDFMQIVLQSATQELDDVIVVAYGTAKKSTFTGSAATVSAKDLSTRPITNAAAVLDGSAPGIQVKAGYGQPGAAPEIRIRGFGSINASSAPLYVIDGAIYDESAFADINPADIESISILKDAASTSLYGSSAGNGVVLITTRKGKSEKPTVTLNISQGVSGRGIPQYDRIDVWEYYPVMWEQLRNQQLSKGLSAADAAAYASQNVFGLVAVNPFKNVPNDQIVMQDGSLNPAANELLWGDDLDWWDAVSRTGYRSDYNLSFNSRSEKSDSYVSVGYLTDNGYIMKTDFNRFSARANVNFQPVKWFKAGVNLSGNRSKSNTTNHGGSTYSNPFYFIHCMGPVYPLHVHDPKTGEYVLDSSGNKQWDYSGDRGSGATPGRHLIAEKEQNQRYFIRNGFSSRGYMDFNILKGLKVTINGAYDHIDRKGREYQNKEVGDGAPGGILQFENIARSTLLFNQLVNYTAEFGEHRLEAMAGHESYSLERNYEVYSRQGQIVDGIYEMGNFTNTTEIASQTDKYKKEGYFGRVNYDYMDKYYASFSYRRDGSSRFHKSSRWGNFWSAGLSWRMDQEKFIQSQKWINTLKIRASYGETGNDLTESYYPYKDLYELGYNNGPEAGIYFESLGNPGLKWETQVSYDAAVEFGLFNFLTGSIEYFNKQSKNLLFSVPVTLQSGATEVWQNIGKVANNGFEISLEAKLIDSPNWRWTVGANATFLSNKIKRLPDGITEIIDGTKRLAEGSSVYDYWMRETVGVNPDNGDLMFAFDEENATWGEDCYEYQGQKVTSNRTKGRYHYAGSAIPDVYGGINTNLKYKDFDLGAVFSYQLGGVVRDGDYNQIMQLNSYGTAMHKDILKSWKKPGDITDIPRLDASTSSSVNNSYVDRWLVSASYFSIKSITLGYTLPKGLVKQASLQNVRLTLSGENLLMLSARKGLNPQDGFNGNSGYSYTPARVFTLGINVSF